MAEISQKKKITWDEIARLVLSLRHSIENLSFQFYTCQPSCKIYRVAQLQVWNIGRINLRNQGCLPFTQTTRMEIFGINTKWFILGDPGADSGAEDQNQNGREKIRRAKVRKKNTSPWGQTLYAPVPNGRTNTRSLAPHYLPLGLRGWKWFSLS